MKQQTGYRYHCNICGTDGIYLTSKFTIAEDFRCPHDGSSVIWQGTWTSEGKWQGPKPDSIKVDEVLSHLQQMNTRK